MAEAPAVSLSDLLQEVGISEQQLNVRVSDDHVRSVSLFLTSRERLAPFLELDEADMEVVEKDGRGEEDKKFKMLQRWRNKNAFKATYRKLVDALLSLGMASHAEKVCRLLLQPSEASAKGNQKCMVVSQFAAVASTRASVKALKLKWARLLRIVCRKLSQENTVVIEDVLLFIFQVLQENKLLDFWNCGLLWDIVNEYLPHDEELPHQMKDYQSELKCFKINTKVINFISIIDSELSPDVSDFDVPKILREDHYQPYTFEMDADPHEATLMDIERSWEAQINQYSLPDLQKGLLQLIAPSSILVTYLIPAKMISAVVERVQACVGKFFTRQNILSVTVCEERVYYEAKFPAELRKKALVQDRSMRETGSLRAEVQWISVQQTAKLPQASSQSPTGLSPHTRLQWRRGADAPERVDIGGPAQAVVMGEKVYVVGRGRVFQYDWKRDTWSTLPDCPVSGFGMAQFMGKLITVGGMDRQLSATGKIYQFNEQQWKEYLPPMPTARYGLNVVTRTSSSPKPPAFVTCGGEGAHNQPVNTVEVYSHASSQWHTAKSLPIPCWLMTSVTIDDTCYFLGGVDSTDSATNCCFSVSLDSLVDDAISLHSQLDDPIWMSVSDTPLTQSTAASLRGSLIAIGGEDTSTHTTSSAIHILTKDGSWERVRGGDLPKRRCESTAVCLPSGELLVAGGWGGSVRAKRTVFIAIVD